MHKMSMGKEILNISCPSCGSPAKFDIVHQIYRCASCGGKVGIEKARQDKLEFQENQRKKLEESAKDYSMSTTSCTGCGATLVFEKDEAISNCTFCGRSLVRKDYVFDEKMPQNIIPFAVTKDEAENILKKWCNENKHKPESKYLMKRIKDLKGYYLPYDMVRGPVRCKVSRAGETGYFQADGYLNDEFVNCSSQMDNRVLDCMEPFNLDNLQEFDFSYVAGQRIKISDIDEREIDHRLDYETSENYRGGMAKIWGTKSLTILSKVDKVVNIPVLLPVYYISGKKSIVAINGQTGKISVRAEKESKYVGYPWWIGGLLTFIITCAGLYAAVTLGTGEPNLALAVTGMLGLVYILIFVAMFEDGENNWFSIKYYRAIFTSGEQTYKREGEKLVLREDIIKRKIEEPVFKLILGGKEKVVTLVFKSFPRIFAMIMKALLVLFFPVIIALVINGFDFERLYLAGSGIWFCIALPTIPAYFIKFGIQALYSDPWVYFIDEKGKKKRYKEKNEINAEEIVKDIFFALFSFPFCLITWLALLSFVMTIYFTAFGAD